MENHELRKEIIAVDRKLNQAFKLLLDKIDQLTPKNKHRKMIGYRREKND